MAERPSPQNGPSAQEGLVDLVQALDDCRGFLASCTTPPRVFSRTPVNADEFQRVALTLKALSGVLALPPIEVCASRPADVNSLDLSLSRYLSVNPNNTLSDPSDAHALVAQWRSVRNPPGVKSVDTRHGSRLQIEVHESSRQPPDAPVVLVVPLCGVPMPALRQLMRTIAQNHTTLSWEPPISFGADPLPAIAGDPVTMLADEIVDVVQACNLEKVHLVAICVAAAPALVAAAKLGTRVQSLSICHAALKVGEQELATPFEKQYNKMMQDTRDNEHIAREIHNTLLEPGFAMSVPPAIAPFILYPYASLPRLRRHALIHSALTEFDARPVAGQIACPAQVLTAQTDRMVHPGQSRQLATLLPDARLHEFDDGNHLDVLMPDNAFLPLIASFISQHTEIPVAH